MPLSREQAAASEGHKLDPRHPGLPGVLLGEPAMRTRQNLREETAAARTAWHRAEALAARGGLIFGE
jgi:hypothetical protein